MIARLLKIQLRTYLYGLTNQSPISYNTCNLRPLNNIIRQVQIRNATVRISNSHIHQSILNSRKQLLTHQHTVIYYVDTAGVYNSEPCICRFIVQLHICVVELKLLTIAIYYKLFNVNTHHIRIGSPRTETHLSNK
jgi:hypothetical protein